MKQLVQSGHFQLDSGALKHVYETIEWEFYSKRICVRLDWKPVKPYLGELRLDDRDSEELDFFHLRELAKLSGHGNDLPEHGLLRLLKIYFPDRSAYELHAESIRGEDGGVVELALLGPDPSVLFKIFEFLPGEELRSAANVCAFWKSVGLLLHPKEDLRFWKKVGGRWPLGSIRKLQRKQSQSFLDRLRLNENFLLTLLNRTVLSREDEEFFGRLNVAAGVSTQDDRIPYRALGETSPLRNRDATPLRFARQTKKVSSF